MHARWLGFAAAFLMGVIATVSFLSLLSSPRTDIRSDTRGKRAPEVNSASGSTARVSSKDEISQLVAYANTSLYRARDVVALQDFAEKLNSSQLSNGAKELLNKYPTPVVSRSLKAILSAWAARDPKSAADFVVSISESRKMQQRIAVEGLLEGWPEGESEVLLGLIERLPRFKERGLPDIFSDYVLQSLLYRAAANDPEGTLETIRRLDLSATMTSDIFQSWASRNPDGAKEWVLQQPLPIVRDRLIRSGIATVSRDAPEKALDWIELLESPAAQESELSFMASQWAQYDAAAVEKLISAQQDPKIREALQRGYLAGLTSVDPAKASALIVSTPGVRENRRLLGDSVERWMGIDRVAALEWVASIPDLPLRSRAIKAATIRWGQDDPAQAIQWFEARVPEGEERRQLIEQINNELREQDSPRFRLRFAEFLDDNKKRELQMRIASEWFRRNPDDAAEWIRNSNLPSGLKNRLLGGTGD
jgi:hypothetical protein